MLQRSEIIKKLKKIIIKFGTTVIVDSKGRLNPDAFRGFASQIAGLLRSGRQVTIVSSGAIAGGVSRLGLDRYPRTVEEKQAVAAVGQNYLMSLYEEAFVEHGISIAQVLLTHDDFINRTRYVNAKNTFNKLYEMGVLPVVNENDAVATEEIRIGDNDNLSAQLVGLVQSDFLLILSDIDGLYDRDPKRFRSAKFIPVVEKITDEWLKIAGATKNPSSVGGMRTKIEAALTACSYGATVLIANGRERDVIRRVFEGEQIGTMFLPRFTGMTARKFWIAFALKPAGSIVVDDGASMAILENNKSLLPRGVKSAEGKFKKGEAVRIINSSGAEIGRGLTRYSSDDVIALSGAKTSEIEKRVGYRGPDEIIHRDDMVIFCKERNEKGR